MSQDDTTISDELFAQYIIDAEDGNMDMFHSSGSVPNAENDEAIKTSITDLLPDQGKADAIALNLPGITKKPTGLLAPTHVNMTERIDNIPKSAVTQATSGTNATGNAASGSNGSTINAMPGSIQLAHPMPPRPIQATPSPQGQVPSKRRKITPTRKIISCSKVDLGAKPSPHTSGR